MSEPAWQREIIELHLALEAYLLGSHADLSRVEAVLANDFTFVGPDAKPTDRAGTIAAISGSQANITSLKIRTVDHELVLDEGGVLIAQYVEEQDFSNQMNRRLSTAIFTASPDAPNGLLWRRIHETWIDQVLG